MKKASSRPSDVSVKRVTASRGSRNVKPKPDGLRAHYDFDYSKSRPNRFADGFAEGTVAVILDADVATVFHSSEAVNAFLRSAISAMPQAETRRRKRTS